MNDKKNSNSLSMFVLSAAFIAASIVWFLFGKIPLGILWFCVGAVELIIALCVKKKDL